MVKPIAAGTIGTLPITLFSGVKLPLPLKIATTLRAGKVPLNLSSATGASGELLYQHLGSNNGYLQIYGVKQTYNGVLMKQMRQPK